MYSGGHPCARPVLSREAFCAIVSLTKFSHDVLVDIFLIDFVFKFVDLVEL